jgi:two-component system catabolic regulation response regulator CreB
VAPRLRAGGIDVIVLDVGLPDISGFEVCRQLRTFSDVPVIFLTARNDEVDRVLGLELGADDYIAKPFSPRELVARVRARLRRSQPMAQARDELQRGDFVIDRDGHRIRFRGHALDLTRYEYALLEGLLQRPGAILSRAQLMDRGWDSHADSADRTVDTHVKTLRAKLRAAGADADLIRTHRGLGYSLEI